MLTALWQAWQDLNNLLDDPAWIEKERQVGTAFVTTGNWMIEDANRRSGIVVMGDGADESVAADEVCTQLIAFCEKNGAIIPMASPDEDRRTRILRLIEIAMPLLVKLLLK